MTVLDRIRWNTKEWWWGLLLLHW